MADVQRMVRLVVMVGVLRLLLLLLLCGLLQQLGMALLKRSYQGIRHLQGEEEGINTISPSSASSGAASRCAGTTLSAC